MVQRKLTPQRLNPYKDLLGIEYTYLGFDSSDEDVQLPPPDFQATLASSPIANPSPRYPHSPDSTPTLLQPQARAPQPKTKPEPQPIPQDELEDQQQPAQKEHRPHCWRPGMVALREIRKYQ